MDRSQACGPKDEYINFKIGNLRQHKNEINSLAGKRTQLGLSVVNKNVRLTFNGLGRALPDNNVSSFENLEIERKKLKLQIQN